MKLVTAMLDMVCLAGWQVGSTRKGVKDSAKELWIKPGRGSNTNEGRDYSLRE